MDAKWTLEAAVAGATARRRRVRARPYGGGGDASRKRVLGGRGAGYSGAEKGHHSGPESTPQHADADAEAARGPGPGSCEVFSIIIGEKVRATKGGACNWRPDHL